MLCDSTRSVRLAIMNDAYTTQQIADLFGVSDQTIREWSERFALYLSPSANPGKKKARLYSQQDLQVLSLVSQMKTRRMEYNEIEASLQAGQRGEAPEITPGELSTLQSNEIQRRLTIQIEYLQRQLDEVGQEVARLKGLEVENARLQATIEALRSQLADQKNNSDQINQLNRLIGRLEYEIETLRKGQKGE